MSEKPGSIYSQFLVLTIYGYQVCWTWYTSTDTVLKFWKPYNNSQSKRVLLTFEYGCVETEVRCEFEDLRGYYRAAIHTQNSGPLYS